MRWQADTGEPATMIGGDFIAPGKPGRQSRAGRAGQTATGYYIDDLYEGTSATRPSAAQIAANLNSVKPQAVVAVASPSSALGKFLIGIFGKPTVRYDRVLGWRLAPGWRASG
jgi:hypothetical protein